MGRGIQLPQFADLAALPAPHGSQRTVIGFGMGEVVLDGPATDLSPVEFEVAFAEHLAGSEAVWSLDILEGPSWAKGLRFYQAAAAWIMVWQVAGALPVAKVIGWSASCWRKSVTKSRQEGRLAPRRHLGKGA